jgi:hypothetical protein
MGDLFLLASKPEAGGAPDRSALAAALRARVTPGTAPCVLVVFGFAGLSEYAERASEEAAEELFASCRTCIEHVIGETGQVYQARWREYFALIDLEGERARELVTRARSQLNRATGAFAVRACFGFALLPGEARFPTQALAVADERLRAMVGDLRPERR